MSTTTIFRECGHLGEVPLLVEYEYHPADAGDRDTPEQQEGISITRVSFRGVSVCDLLNLETFEEQVAELVLRDPFFDH